MNFTDIFIRRPVFATALSLMLLLAGIISFYKMPLRELPNLESSVVTVTTNYPGADAELMSSFITTPLENAMGGVDGIDYMTSSNTQSNSVITLNFKLGYPIDKALNDVSNAVSSAKYLLPKQAFDPVISKVDPSAQPTVYLRFRSATMSTGEVSDYLLRVVQPQLATLNGVGSANILGGRQYAMRLNLDSEKMKAMNITASDVAVALQAHNLQAAAGTVYAKYMLFNVTANTDMDTTQEFNEMAIKTVNGHIVRLQDIGQAILGSLTYSSSAFTNGKTITVIGITPTSDANPLDVSDEVKNLLPSIEEHLPSGLEVDVVYDKSVFINASIHEVYSTMFEAAIFVILVIFLFLGSFRAVIIPIVTIPLSLVGVSTIMLILGYSINTLTLLAWVLAIGLVVDDAIVVLENVHRHMEEGLAPIPAAIIGAREIGFAIVAMTITLAVVYTPIGFQGGLTGILFSEFAFTLAGAVVVSGFVALTLSPMMCSRILTYDVNKTGGFAHWIDNQFTKLMNVYKKVIRKVFTFRWVVVAFILFMWCACFHLYATTRGELAPVEDQGVIFTIINGPAGTNIKYTEKYTSLLPSIYNTIPEIRTSAVINGYSGENSAIAFAPLIPWDKRTRTQQQLTQTVFAPLWSIPGLQVFPVNLPSIPIGGNNAIEFVISSPNGIKELLPAINGMLVAAYQNPGFRGADIDLKIDQPQVHVEIDRNKAADLGISESDIANALATMFGTPQQVQFSLNGRGYYVIPEFQKNFDYNANPNDLDNIYVRGSSQQLIPLSNVVKVENTVAPESINHFMQIPSATFTSQLTQTYSQGEALQFLQDYMKKNYPNINYNYTGQLRQFVESQGAMVQVLIMAALFIFLVLAAQFESYRDPLIILAVVPLTLAAAIATLRLKIGGTMNIYTQIGLATLIGLIAKHGILIVEFANQLQEKGMDKVDAVIEAAALRLRPILMTTGAMVLGAFPLVIASGAGANARNQMGLVIVGGMLFGTLFSLFVVPTLYTLIAKVKKNDEVLERQIQDAIEKSKKHV